MGDFSSTNRMPRVLGAVCSILNENSTFVEIIAHILKTPTNKFVGAKNDV